MKRGQADVFDELRARVGSWPPLRPGVAFMPLGRQAKTLTDRQRRRGLERVATHRYPERDTVLLLLSFKAGLRAKEIAGLTWAMVTDSARPGR